MVLSLENAEYSVSEAELQFLDNIGALIHSLELSSFHNEER